jgi:hypothetical protein
LNFLPSWIARSFISLTSASGRSIVVFTSPVYQLTSLLVKPNPANIYMMYLNILPAALTLMLMNAAGYAGSQIQPPRRACPTNTPRSSETQSAPAASGRSPLPTALVTPSPCQEQKEHQNYRCRSMRSQ